MIVGLGHQARVGKDTAASRLVNHYGFKRLAFADVLKQVLYDINPIVSPTLNVKSIVDESGWELAKEMYEVRRLLQDLGVAARERIDPDAWVNPVMRELDIYQDFVITDVRFPNEFSALWRQGAHMVKITRDSAQGNAGVHQSEIALADAEWGTTIENNGTILELEENLVGALGL